MGLRRSVNRLDVFHHRHSRAIFIRRVDLLAIPVPRAVQGNPCLVGVGDPDAQTPTRSWDRSPSLARLGADWVQTRVLVGLPVGVAIVAPLLGISGFGGAAAGIGALVSLRTLGYVQTV